MWKTVDSSLAFTSKHIESNIKNYSLTYRKQAENLVRFERQCIRPYDLKLKSIENAKVNDWAKYFTEVAALEALETFHRYHIKDGDYYSFDSVTEYLKYKIKSKEVFQTAIETLRFIFSEGSISKAQNAIIKSSKTVPKRFSAQYRNLSVKQMQKSFNDFIRNHLTNNGVNPIIIPNELGVDFLPNSIKYLKTNS